MTEARIPWYVWAIGLGGIAYFLYTFVKKQAPLVASGAAQGAQSALLNLGPVGMAVNPTMLLAAWSNLQSLILGPSVQVLGSIRMPDGSLVPLNSLASNGAIRQDASTPPNVYADVQGNIYQLAASDSQGNYPATLIGPSPTGS